jgi:hypothetical protein
MLTNNGSPVSKALSNFQQTIKMLKHVARLKEQSLIQEGIIPTSRKDLLQRSSTNKLIKRFHKKAEKAGGLV